MVKTNDNAITRGIKQGVYCGKFVESCEKDIASTTQPNLCKLYHDADGKICRGKSFGRSGCTTGKACTDYDKKWKPKGESSSTNTISKKTMRKDNTYNVVRKGLNENEKAAANSMGMTITEYRSFKNQQTKDLYSGFLNGRPHDNSSRLQAQMVNGVWVDSPASSPLSRTSSSGHGIKNMKTRRRNNIKPKRSNKKRSNKKRTNNRNKKKLSNRNKKRTNKKR